MHSVHENGKKISDKKNELVTHKMIIIILYNVMRYVDKWFHIGHLCTWKDMERIISIANLVTQKGKGTK